MANDISKIVEQKKTLTEEEVIKRLSLAIKH